MIKFKLILWKYRQNQFNEFPIYLRLTKFKTVKYLSSEIHIKENEWNEAKSLINFKNPKHKILNTVLDTFFNDKKSKYNNLLLEQKESISIDEYLELIKPKNQVIESKDFFDHIDRKINENIELEKISTALYYKDCKKSIVRFIGVNKLELSAITPQWLKKYELWQRKNGSIDTGISAKMRAIRAVYNDAISKNALGNEYYPFSRTSFERKTKYNISSLSTKTKKRAIVLEDMKSIIDFDTKQYPNLKLSRDLFVFSYYIAGINFIDIMKLTYNQIINNRIVYQRSKSKSPITIAIRPEVQEILDYYKANNNGTKYVFPILLSDDLTAKQIFYRKQKTLNQFNKDLKEIGRICQIDFDLSSYVSRHSFATNLKHLNVSTDQISELLGHSDIKVTQVYLDSFDNKEIDRAINLLPSKS